MPSIPELAEVLAANLPQVLEARDLQPEDLDRVARLPAGMTRRLIECDPSVYPCPRQWRRISMALQVDPGELLTP